MGRRRRRKGAGRRKAPSLPTAAGGSEVKERSGCVTEASAVRVCAVETYRGSKVIFYGKPLKEQGASETSVIGAPWLPLLEAASWQLPASQLGCGGLRALPLSSCNTQFYSFLIKKCVLSWQRKL